MRCVIFFILVCLTGSVEALTVGVGLDFTRENTVYSFNASYTTDNITFTGGGMQFGAYTLAVNPEANTLDVEIVTLSTNTVNLTETPSGDTLTIEHNISGWTPTYVVYSFIDGVENESTFADSNGFFNITFVDYGGVASIYFNSITLASSGVNIAMGVFVGGNSLQRDMNFSTVVVDTVKVNFSGYGDFDCWAETNGLYKYSGFDGGDCLLRKVTSDTVWFEQVVAVDGSILVINHTGNLTYHPFFYNSTGQGNITLTLDNLSNACNYGILGDASNSLTVFYFPFNSSVDYDKCNVTFVGNGSVYAGAWVIVGEDKNLSYLAVAGIVGVLTFVYLVKAVKWDTES